MDLPLKLQELNVEMARELWFNTVTREGRPIQTYDKVGPWKCPYHNGRACMEVMVRLGE